MGVQKALPILTISELAGWCKAKQDWRLNSADLREISRWVSEHCGCDGLGPQRSEHAYEAKCTAPVRARFLSL